MNQLFDPVEYFQIDLDEEDGTGFTSKVSQADFSSEDFNRWKKEYTHPLLSGHIGSQAMVFDNKSRRIETRDDMLQQYDHEADDQQQSDRPVHRNNKETV